MRTIVDDHGPLDSLFGRIARIRSCFRYWKMAGWGEKIRDKEKIAHVFARYILKEYIVLYLIHP